MASPVTQPIQGRRTGEEAASGVYLTEIALVTAPSRRSVDVLRRRRDALIAALESVGEDASRRRALVRALDRVVRQLEAVG